MLHYEFSQDDSILIVTPDGPLTSTDFDRLAMEVDPLIEEKKQN